MYVSLRLRLALIEIVVTEWLISFQTPQYNSTQNRVQPTTSRKRRKEPPDDLSSFCCHKQLLSSSLFNNSYSNRSIKTALKTIKNSSFIQNMNCVINNTDRIESHSLHRFLYWRKRKGQQRLVGCSSPTNIGPSSLKSTSPH